MTNLGTAASPDPTSAVAVLAIRPVRDAMIVGVMLAGLGTSALPATEITLRTVQMTTAGAPVAQVERAGSAIAELRRLSGLTWEQLARLFNVSRRSLHFWASGKAMAAGNEVHLHRILAVLREADHGSAGATRTRLLAIGDDGAIPLDLLASGHYDRALSILGAGSSLLRTKVTRPAPTVADVRAPRPPDELVDALQDRVHRERGIARAAQGVKVRGDR